MSVGLLDRIAFPLFVPADRPERIAKAMASGADAVIIDLEDAVAPENKDRARSALAQSAAGLASASCPVLLRINAMSSPFHREDIGLAAQLPIAGLVVPKAEAPLALFALRQAMGETRAMLALVETARGIRDAHAIAASTDRLIFGSIDYALDVGCAQSREALLHARSCLVVASRAAGLPGPIDGITQALDDPAVVESDAAHAAALGFTGKLLIHPRQLGPARAGFAPTREDVVWAERIVATAQNGSAAAVDGIMVDLPVRLRAETILRRARPHIPHAQNNN